MPSFGERCGQAVELLSGAGGIARSFRAHGADDVLHFDCFVRQGTACAFPRRVPDVPTLGDEAVEASRKAKFALDRVMGEIVQREERSAMIVLPLPGRRAISPNTAEQGAAIVSFGELDFQNRSKMVRGRQAVIPSRADGEGPRSWK